MSQFNPSMAAKKHVQYNKFITAAKKSSKALQSCARKHDKNIIEGRRSRKETQINKGLACYLLSYFFFLTALSWPGIIYTSRRNR